jgi:hypothetical protein
MMWGHVGSASGRAAGDTRSRGQLRSEAEAAMSGPAQSIEARSSEIGHLRFRRERLIDLGNRARMLRQRKRAAIIDASLRAVTMEILRHEVRHD